MELVLSPGFIGDNDGSPFHNEDVHEWSHVDHLTGMLENARIETGRWQAKNHGAAQSYGKVIDSRERNSADGNVVQRAQRKVEVFQSQGVGGKSIQVVRASQWSSSRVSDLIHSSPLTKLAGEYHASELDSGIKSRLNEWSLSKDSQMMDPFSSLSRKFHSELVNSSALQTDKKLGKKVDLIDRKKYDSSTMNEKKSNSNEDLASPIQKEDFSPSFNLNFARDFRVRRSLQLSNKKNLNPNVDSNYSGGVKLSDLNSEVHLEEDKYPKNSYSPESLPKHYIGRNSNISNKRNIVPNPKPLTYFCQDPLKSRESLLEVQKPTSIRLCAQETSRPLASNTNKTIVHLGKAEDESRGQINVSIDINIKNNENDLNVMRDSNSQESKVLFLSDCSAKPTKKVLFCKTEVHFVADSGKVNIVETDGKPPPTNRFRRRRRNSNSNGNNNNNNNNLNSLGISEKKNLPVVHFGDTSYEKFIFGASKKQVSREREPLTKPRELGEDYKSLDNESNLKNLKKDFSEVNQINIQDKILDQRLKGHTTTVNFGANGFCNLRSGVRDNISKLSNVEEFSLEAPKIISALDLITRKDDHKAEKLKVKPCHLEAERSEEMISGENQILIKPMAIHRPVIARVDFNHFGEMISPRLVKSNEVEKIKISSRLEKSSEVEKIPSRLVKSNDSESKEMEKIASLTKSHEVEQISPRLTRSREVEKTSSCPETVLPFTYETKDFCDVSSGEKEEICDSSVVNPLSPIYANVFDSVRKDVPIYENFQIKKNSDGELNVKKIKDEERWNENAIKEPKMESSKAEGEEVPKKIQRQIKQKSILGRTGSENMSKSCSDSNRIPPIRRSKKDADTDKEKQILNLDKVKRVSKKCSSEISNSHDKTKNTEDEKLKTSRASSLKRDLKKTGSKSHSSKHLGNEMVAKVETTESMKKKKPVEVVYKTAVYNMKNEKLSKPTKTKESKGPRYINDIICGSKERKSSGEKHTKTNTTSQQKNTTKGTSLINRK